MGSGLTWIWLGGAVGIFHLFSYFSFGEWIGRSEFPRSLSLENMYSLFRGYSSPLNCSCFDTLSTQEHMFAECCLVQIETTAFAVFLETLSVGFL